jgi:hypothetical protein
MKRGLSQKSPCRIDDKLTNQAREWLGLSATLVGRQAVGGLWLLFQEGMPPLPLGNSRAKATDALWRMAEGLPPISEVRPELRVESVVTPSEIRVSVTHLATGAQRTATARPEVVSREVLEDVLVAELVSATPSAAA